MSDIDFIKKCCEFAEGFAYEPITPLTVNLYYPTDEKCRLSFGTVGLNGDLYWKVLFPLLLQRAIEGINKLAVKDSENITIKQFSHDIVVDLCGIGGGMERFKCKDFSSIDEAKRKALEYVFEKIE